MATNRQIIAVKKLVEIVGKYKGQKKISMRSILKDAGFSKDICDNPKKVTEGKGFQVELAKAGDFISEKKLSKAHQILITSSRIRRTYFNNAYTDNEIKKIIKGISGAKLIDIHRSNKIGGINEVWYSIPIGGNIKVGVDLAYKLKGSYAPEKQKVDITGELNTVELTNYGTKHKFKQN
jgi:hypothetical protein